MMERTELKNNQSQQSEDEIRRTARYRLLKAGIRSNDPVTKRTMLESYIREYRSNVADLFYIRALDEVMTEPNFTLTQWGRE